MESQLCTIQHLAVFGAALLVIAQGRAADINWTNSSGGNWNRAANWEPNQVPSASDNAVITNDGTYTVTLNANATVASLTLGGSSGTQTLVINSPTLTLNSASLANSNSVVAFSGGTIIGSGLLTVGGLLDWTGGTMAGSGTTVIAEGATLNVSGSAEKRLEAHSVTNRGTVSWSGSGKIVSAGASAIFANEPDGVFEVQSDAIYENDYWSGGGPFLNAGLFRKTGGTGTTTFSGIPFYNTGTVSVCQGVLSFPAGLNLSSAGTVEFSLAGVNYPDDYGRIASSKSLPLAGRLAVTFRTSFVPGQDQYYDVMAAPIAGQFADFTAPIISPNVFVNPVYRPNLVQLVITGPTASLSSLTMDAQRRLTFDIHGIASQNYVVEASTNLFEWTPLATNSMPGSTIWRFVDEDSIHLPYRF